MAGRSASGAPSSNASVDDEARAGDATSSPEAAPPERFEAALERLELLVDQLDAGDLELEESLARFEEGVRLVRFCSERLRAAELRVQELREGPDGLRIEPLELEGGE